MHVKENMVQVETVEFPAGMEVIDQKVELLMRSLDKFNPKLRDECEIEKRDDGSRLVYGPFPSFLILVTLIGQAKSLVHVNADAPNMVGVFNALGSSSISFDGPFAVDSVTGDLITGQDAYAKKEENVLAFAQEILGRRQQAKQEGIVVPDKKIIIAK